MMPCGLCCLDINYLMFIVFFVSVTECKEKWKNIRNGFVRSLKPAQNGSLKKPYYLYDAMQFVVPYINPAINIQLDQRRLKSSNVENEALEDSSDDDQSITVKQEPIEIEIDPLKNSGRNKSRKPLRRPRGPEMANHMFSKRMRPDDPKRMFLLSLLPDLRDLTDRQLSVFRIKVLMLLEDVRGRSSSELREMLGQ